MRHSSASLRECTELLCRHLRSHHAAVLINLCIALIIANLIFLIGANQVNNTVSIELPFYRPLTGCLHEAIDAAIIVATGRADNCAV